MDLYSVRVVIRGKHLGEWRTIHVTNDYVEANSKREARKMVSAYRRNPECVLGKVWKRKAS